MISRSSHFHPGPAAKRGFALLLTLTLLAFAVLLLVGLAAYTRVETAVVGNMQRQAQARENALLALNVALGQLQRHAGPDTRVTARAEAMESVDPQKRYYTGVWDSAAAGPTPLAWLASGVETAAVDVTEAIANNRRITLLGAKTDGSTATNAITAELQDITVPGVPGLSGNNNVHGRYAWWVGDQGVKAPVAVEANTNAIDYAPFAAGTATDLRARIRQQIALGAGAASSAGEPAFEVRDANNAPLLAGQKITAPNQLAFLRTPSDAALGLAAVRQNYHAWSPNNFAVIADTKNGGLRQDLSLKPELLGTAFARWADYSSYMEPITTPTEVAEGEAPPAAATFPISPPYGEDPLRRRYVMTPHLISANGAHQVGPILTYFLLSFNVRTEQTAGGNPSSAPRPLEVRARWMLSLWNPYTSALVPENLQVDIVGLPTSLDVVNEEPTRSGVVASVPLQSAFGLPLRIDLPWDSENVPAGSPTEDRSSWLPGRVYTWRVSEDVTKALPSAPAGYASTFYSRTLSDGGQGVIGRYTGPLVDGNDRCHLESRGGGAVLTIMLYATRPDGTRALLGRYTSPAFVTGFTTQTQAINLSSHQFSYVFRLAESVDTPAAPGAWLTGPQGDPRLSRLAAGHFIHGENGDDPAQYGDGYRKISSPNRLLDRAENGWSFNEDVPLFELPRGPLLSLGALQHFRIRASRPFMIGNPWGVRETLNAVPLGQLFDRYYFSGIAPGVTPATNRVGDLVLPNLLLKPLRKADGSKVAVEDIRATAEDTVPETPPDDITSGAGDEQPTTPPTAPTPVPGTGRSSKFLLQAAAFNINSANATAWAAVLRSVRFSESQAFTYLDPSADVGTAADTARAAVHSGDAQFFRFSQSAQETFKSEAGASAPGEDVTPPNTHLFRRGMRTLTAAQVAALAGKIAELVKLKLGSTDEVLGGPFRSMEEFLSPSSLFAGVDIDGNPLAPRSLLEAAIADANINVDDSGNPIEFSSQFLTQADIMTALAPVLFPRSDTFIVRTHGQALNPVTGAVEGRAWCEATVQRVPEYFDPAADDAAVIPSELTSELNKLYGRRFKIVSFRWLTLSDI